MSLLRFAARSLLATYFITEGVNTFRSASERAPEAEKLTKRVAPLVQRVVPSPASSYIPEHAETWVRISGAAQVVGGLMFATGLGRRPGAMLLAKASVLNVAMAMPGKDADADAKAAARPEIIRNLAFLGAAVLGSQDLQGKPSLSWRASHAADKAEKRAEKTASSVSKRAKKAQEKAEKRAKKSVKQAKKRLK